MSFDENDYTIIPALDVDMSDDKIRYYLTTVPIKEAFEVDKKLGLRLLEFIGNNSGCPHWRIIEVYWDLYQGVKA